MLYEGEKLMRNDYLDGLVAENGRKVYAMYNAPKDREVVYVGRGTIFGNQFKTMNNKTIEDRINNCLSYRYYLIDRVKNDETFRQAVKELYGKTLVCYCSNGTTSVEDGARYCHAHILVAAANYLNLV